MVVDLARIVGAQHVSNLDADRIAYARDAWPRDVLLLWAGRLEAAPSCVVWPGSPEEVARVVDYGTRHGIPLVPYGAGSGVVGGARPTRGGIVLDLKRLRAVRKLDVENLRTEVEVGLIGERFERHLQAHGLTLGHFPSSIGCSTVGGWLAARSAGQMSTRYGKIEDMTFGLEVVTAGRIRRLMLGPRPATAGPDFNALLLGSEGILGVITAAELRLRRQPEARRFAGYMFSEVAEGIEAIRRLLRAGLRPSVVRLYDALDTLLGRGHGADQEAHDEVRSWDALSNRTQDWMNRTLDRVPFPRGPMPARLRSLLVRGTVRAVLGAPIVLNRALRVLPDDCLLVLGFEGHPALVAAEASEADGIATAEGGTSLGPGPGEHWFKNRYNVSFKQSKVYASGLFVDTMEVAATWDRLLPLYRAVKRAIARDAVVMAHFSHAYGEGCSIYFTFAGVHPDRDDPRGTLVRYDRIWSNALGAVHESGGTIAHHHGVGESKAAFMVREHGPGGMRFLSALKSAFDPDGVLNPAKLGVEPLPRTVGLRGRPGGSTRGPEFPEAIAHAVGERNLIRTRKRTLVRPPDESALAAVLRVAHGRGIPLYCDQTAFRPVAGAVHLDLSRLEGINRISDHALFVEVEAGLLVSRLETQLESHGLTLGPVHPRAFRRSVGAALSRNLLVRRGPAHGDLGAICFAVRGLLADGTAVQTRPVPRAAAGPELDRAFLGAGGRLGVMTKATLRVVPRPLAVESKTFSFPDLQSAIAWARGLLQRGLEPEAARIRPTREAAAGSVRVAASSPSTADARWSMVHTLATERGGRRAGAELDPTGGRFDAVVEVAVLWTQARRVLLETAAVVGGDVWLDFFCPEGATVVARVPDRDARRRVTEIGIELGGRVLAGSRDIDSADLLSFSLDVGASGFAADAREPHPYADVLGRLSQRIDLTGVFRGR